MNQEDIKKQLAIIDSIRDEDIDYSDIPDMGDADWSKFKIFDPSKTSNLLKRSITIRLDDEVIDYFKSFGKGYQTKINAALKEHIKHNLSL